MIDIDPRFGFLAVTILSVSLVMAFAAGLLFIFNRQMGYSYQKYWGFAWLMMAAYSFFGGIAMVLRVLEIHQHWGIYLTTLFSQFFGYGGPLLLLAGYLSMTGREPFHGKAWWIIALAVISLSIVMAFSYTDGTLWKERYISRVGLRSLFCVVIASWVALKTVNHFKEDTKSGPKIFAYALLIYGLSWSVYVVASVDMYFGGVFYRYLAVFGIVEFICQVAVIYGFTTWAIQNEKEKVANAQAKLEEMAWIDSLTHLYNRRWLDSHANDWLTQHGIAMNQVAVMFIDLDGFKQINDKYGHKIGDELLQMVAMTINKSSNDTDIVCRLGGDEFIFVCTTCRSKEDAKDKANQIRESIRAIKKIDSHSVSFSCSIGISCPEQDLDLQTLTQASDKAMYVAKTKGKDTIEFAQPSHYSSTNQQ